MDIHSSNQIKVMVQIFEIYTASKMKKSLMKNFIIFYSGCSFFSKKSSKSNEVTKTASDKKN